MRPAFLLPLILLAAPTFAASGKVVLGKLGQTTSAAQIYAAPSPKARGVFRVEAGTRVVLRAQGPRWSSVVLRDGRLGYVPAQAVELVRNEDGVTYEVTSESAPQAVRRPFTVASRGGYVRGDRTRAAMNAMSLEGSTPYKWGGTELGSGIDCSGFVKKMYGEIGLSLPRTAAEQATVGQPITNYQDLQPGDRLYFWDAKRGKIGHTGLYVGGGYFTHSSSGHHGIARDYLSERWRKICVAARR